MRIALVAATDDIADARRKLDPGGSLGRLQCILRGLGRPDGKFRKLSPSTAPAVLRRNPSLGGGRPSVSGVSGNDKSQRDQQVGAPSAQQRGYGRDVESFGARDAG